MQHMYSVFVLALLSERCNSLKTIATKILMETIFVENFMQNIFGNLTFFSKVHIPRGNWEKVILGSRFHSFHQGGSSWGPWVLFGNTWGHAEELPGSQSSKAVFWKKQDEDAHSSL